MPQGINTKMINFVHKNGHKGHQIKGQISDGIISQKICLEKYYLCGKFDSFMKKCTIFWLCFCSITACWKGLGLLWGLDYV